MRRFEKINKRLLIIIVITFLLILIAGIMFYYKAKTFKATIKEVREYNEIVTLLIEELDENNINYRGEYIIKIDEYTKLLWKGKNINISDLKIGQRIKIKYNGDRLDTSPATLMKVTKILVLDDTL